MKNLAKDKKVKYELSVGSMYLTAETHAEVIKKLETLEALGVKQVGITFRIVDGGCC